jgi:hypothetical protein
MPVWQLTDRLPARVQLERFGAAVDPLNPAAGAHDARIDGEPIAGLSALGVALAPRASDAAPPIERYVRGGDLIVTYPDQPAPAMRTQLYWRATAHPRRGAIAALALVASVQTDLLDSRPSLTVHTQLVAEEALRMSDPARGRFVRILSAAGDAQVESPEWPRCYLVRLAGGRYSYAEMVPPSAEGHSRWEAVPSGSSLRFELRHELFARPLEKGVILRERVLGVLLERAGDEQAAARHWANLLGDELPLTA